VTDPNLKELRSTSASLRSGEPGIDPTSQNTSEPAPTNKIEDDMMTTPPERQVQTETTKQDTHDFTWIDETSLQLDRPRTGKCEMSVKGIRVHGRNKLTKHLIGEECWMVTYQHNIDFIREYIEDLGYKNLKVIIGKSMSIAWQKANDAELFAKLARWQLDGTLNVRVATNNWIMHEKWFLCWDYANCVFMELNGSANPTLHGDGRIGKQSNRETKITLSGDYESHNHYLECLEGWKWYEDNSEPFLGSLLELLENKPEEEWVPTIVQYFETDGELETADPLEVIRIHQDIGRGLHQASVRGEKMYRMVVDDRSEASVEAAVDSLFSTSMGIERRGSELIAPVSALDIDARTVGAFPMMSIIDRQVWVRHGSENRLRTANDLSPEGINLSLKMFEEYVDTMSLADSADYNTAKRALAEYLLAGLCAPFEHLYMEQRRKRRKRSMVGPRMTSFFGKAGNGKTYACKYLLKLLNGVDFDPLTSADFTSGKVLKLLQTGSIHPLIFDDLARKRFGKNEWETWGKAYWDTHYELDSPHAQILVTANDRRDSGGPLGRRVREISMHASFEDTDENGDIVEMHLDRENDLFLYFSKLVLDDYYSGSPSYSHIDELKIGRKALEQMYDITGRKKPKWFPGIKIEEAYDENANQWLDMINKGICSVKTVQDEVIASFDKNSHSSEIGGYRKLLPTVVAAEQAGTKIRIKNSARFKKWLKEASQCYPSRVKWRVKRFVNS